MRSFVVLWLLVGLAFSSESPAWNQAHHYIYNVRGRSLASLNQISNDYSGIFFKAQLSILPQSDGKLAARILHPQYAQIHAELEYGWDTHIPDSQLSFKELPLSTKPFEIYLKDNVIRNIAVSSEITNWETNIIKAIVSQFQLDTKGKNVIPSSINILTQDDSNSAVFKTMEETVTGVSETVYEIHPYPEYVLQSRPWLVPLKEFAQHGEVIEIVKNKNFTHSPQAPAYHAGFEGIPGFHPGNKIGNFLTRSSVCQAIITGSLKQYTIQSAVTVEKIVLSPTFADQQKGSVHNKLNVTLAQVVAPLDANQFTVNNPVKVGVVYGYNKPFATENSPRPAKEFDHGTAHSSAESQSGRSQRFARSHFDFHRNNFISDMEDQEWYQEKPHLNEAPPSPLLPFTVGHNGQSFKKTQNIVEVVRRLADEIGQESQDAKKILHQQTPGKFITMVALTRIMNEKEIEQVASQLYTNQPSPAWIAFRDAVAETGTGPAIMNIRKWIESKKIHDVEAAQVIASAVDATRVPTESYVKFLNEMIKDQEFMSRPYVNASLLLSYTTLVRNIYGNQQESNGKFPTHSYGPFDSERGFEFVKKDTIPFLTGKLNEAINKADTHKIHTYIRALGNIGQQEILEAFEQYLEGQRKASHFQRILMVAALDQLARSNPRVARSVLYKIYQNPSEAEEVRVAAVYQLMRTNPPASMLQRMATYTKADANNYVNAAVKSVIESAAQLQHPEHYKLRVAAQSAKPLLTTEQYGAQYSQGFLRSLADKEINLAYKQSSRIYSGKDHAYPKGLKYHLRRTLGGVEQNLLHFQAMTSSIEDLINVFQQRTEEYKHIKEEKQSHEAIKHPWSSEYFAQMLNLQNEQREQLEGNMYVQLAALQTIFSFDNRSMEYLPREIQELENQLKQNQNFKYNKMFIGKEQSLAFPTVLGLPFVYTKDHPVLARFEGEVKAIATPQFSNGDMLHRPDTIEIQFNIKNVVSGRVQTQFGIFTPFDHQRYSAGYTKNFQAVVPLKGQFFVNIQKRQLKLNIENPAHQENVRLAHYSSWPYTLQSDIYTPKPDLKIIRSQNPHRRNFIVGNKATGIAFYGQVTSDRRMDFASLYEKLQHRDALTAFLYPWVSENIQYVHADFGIDAGKSTTKQIKLKMAYKTDYQSNQNAYKENLSDEKYSDIPRFPEDADQRLNQFLKNLGKSISAAEIAAGDITVEFEGQVPLKYVASIGASKSNVDPHARFLAFFQRVDSHQPATAAFVQALAKAPNTNGLNADFAMQMQPVISVDLQGLVHHNQKLSKFQVHTENSKSQRRAEYLKQQPQYQECKEQMQQGNMQLPACAEVTAKANLLDKFFVQMQYKDLDRHIVNATYKVYSFFRHHLYPRFEENIFEYTPSDNLEINGQFSPDLRTFNVSINTEAGKAHIHNVHINKWVRDILVPHPVFHIRSRLMGQALKEESYRPFCTIDANQANTFDNRTFPASLSNAWTVLLQYVPRRPSSIPNKPEQTVVEQLHQTAESYVVYARAEQSRPGSPEKEVQVFLQMPSTQGKVTKIVMKSWKQDKGPKVYVNDQEVKYNAESSADFYDAHIQVYALPNHEVKVEFRHAFYIIFNGQTLKITTFNSKFRDATRGLCGTFTGEEETDFVGPEDCILRNPNDFVEANTAQPQPRSRNSRSTEGHCYQKKVTFANYISNQDAGRSSGYTPRGGDECTGHLSRYENKNGEICFTVRALPYCKPGCKSVQAADKLVDVHCMAPSPTTAYWRNKLDQMINQDFSMMEPTEQLTMKVPGRCVP